MFRKKGIYTIGSIFCMVGYLALGAVLINTQAAYETHRRVLQAATEAAQERARATDTYLKEAEGVIEIYRSSASYTDNVVANSKTGAPYDPHYGYKTPQRPSSTAYQNMYTKANAISKQTAVDYVEATIFKNANNKKILSNFDVDNVCIDVKPLPATNQTVSFSCNTKLGTVSHNNIDVKTIPEATYTIYDPDGVAGNGDEYKLKVLNVAFVGVKYERRYFMSKIIDKLGADSTRTETARIIAYPQIDRCYEGATYCTN